eukprot:scaffold5662_cov55-Phaeocystis_antarctica.AAC.1
MRSRGTSYGRACGRTAAHRSCQTPRRIHNHSLRKASGLAARYGCDGRAARASADHVVVPGGLLPPRAQRRQRWRRRRGWSAGRRRGRCELADALLLRGACARVAGREGEELVTVILEVRDAERGSVGPRQVGVVLLVRFGFIGAEPEHGRGSLAALSGGDGHGAVAAADRVVDPGRPGPARRQRRRGWRGRRRGWRGRQGRRRGRRRRRRRRGWGRRGRRQRLRRGGREGRAEAGHEADAFELV